MSDRSEDLDMHRWLVDSLSDSTSILGSDVILDWLLGEVTAPERFPTIMMEGSGPLDEFKLRRYLERRGYRLCWLEDALWPDEAHEEDSESTSEVLVVGYEPEALDWLDCLIRLRSGKTLRVYSQEMFLTFAVSGKDPFDRPREFLAWFGAKHPVLQLHNPAHADQ